MAESTETAMQMGTVSEEPILQNRECLIEEAPAAQKLPGTSVATAQALAVEELDLAQMWQQIPNVACGDRSQTALLCEKKKAHPFPEDISKWHTSVTAAINVALLFFYPKSSCAHTKCETIAPNILVLLAEELNIASSITYYITDASKLKLLNLIS